MSTAQDDCAAAVECIRGGNFEDARGLLERSVAAFVQSFGEEHQVTAVAQRELARVYIQLEQYDKAEGTSHPAPCADRMLSGVAEKSFDVLYDASSSPPGSGAVSALARLILARAGLHKWAVLESELSLGSNILKGGGVVGEAARELKAALIHAKRTKAKAEESILQVLDSIVEPAQSPRESSRPKSAAVAKESPPPQ